jgi:hypothetical protein
VPGPTAAIVLDQELVGWDGRPATQATRVHAELQGSFRGGRLAATWDCAFASLDVDPALATDRPAPRLWEHDVVELFLGAGPTGCPYVEVEVSPLGQWLALAFSAPRVEVAGDPPPRPLFRVERAAGRFAVRIELDLEHAFGPGGAARSGAIRIGMFRILGQAPAREHLALRPGPAGSAPDFHRPQDWLEIGLGMTAKGSR